VKFANGTKKFDKAEIRIIKMEKTVQLLTLAGIYDSKSFQWEILEGGVTNTNVKVQVAGKSYYVRIPIEESNILGIDRHIESEIIVHAETASLTPKSIYFDKENGSLVRTYVEGKILDRKMLANAKLLNKLAARIKALHSIVDFPSFYSVFEAIRQFKEKAVERGVQLPDYAKDTLVALKLAESRLPRTSVSAPCHNDLLFHNIVYDGSQFWFLDWEYAGQGDPLYDLAKLSQSLMFDEEATRTFVSLYSSESVVESLYAVRIYQLASLAEGAFWALVRSTISESSKFLNDANNLFKRIQLSIETVLK